ncbi:MAG: homoserine kinase [Woeseiaceae bacterium]|nr:homoserine kinase [Woeseiaceae bacterium]NIP19874.1 homoserine kinase [Woeseiaceae bacterium]NIS88675.1 homoserine kinase [Woeseiaceae bacterium]
MGESVTAFAPASIGNVGVGFDMLGLALDGVGDHVIARRKDQPGISVSEVLGLDGAPHPYLSKDPEHNTASIAVKALWNDYGDDHGVDLRIHKGVPLQSGMGSSAASAVAATFAVNQLLGTPLPTPNLLPYALAGEQYASGGLHADNVAPSLLGGMIYCPKVLLPETVRMPVPKGVSAVLIHPELQVNTAHARRKLAKAYSMEQWLEQQAYFGGFLAACAASDLELIRKTLKDVIVEPQRASAVSCFAAVKDAAVRGGALGCSLSGSGPSIFALTESGKAGNLATAMEQACRSLGIDCQSWVSSLDAPGAHLEA